MYATEYCCTAPLYNLSVVLPRPLCFLPCRPVPIDIPLVTGDSTRLFYPQAAFKPTRIRAARGAYNSSIAVLAAAAY